MRQVRAAILGAAASLFCTLLLLSTAYARADEAAPQPFDIRPQSLAAALTEFARQSRQEILFSPEVVAEKPSAGVRGTMRPLAALSILLKDSGLSYSSTPNGAILIGAPGSAALPKSSGNSATHDQSGSEDVGKEGKSRSSEGFRVAQVDQGQDRSAAPVAKQGEATSQTTPPELEQVVVTAQKREERLQDVPVPVTAIGADSLIASNQLRIQDYYTSVPGLNVALGDRGAPMLSIRGVTTGGNTNPTVGIVVDDVPYGSSSGLAYGNQAPDIDPSELARIEVLRGPQGTLYGASSIGGLLKFVTVDPSTDAVRGNVQAGTSAVHNGAEAGYNVRGAVNIPLTDTLAVRASGFARRDPGYVDDPTLHVDGVNKQDVEGGRLSALWRPTEALALKLSALIQHTSGDGLPTVDVEPGLGDLQQSGVRGAGAYDRKVQAYSATVTAKIGAADFVALSGYNVNRFSDGFDYSASWGPLSELFFQVAGAPVFEHLETKKFTQEVRLSAPLGERIDGLIGGFFNHEDSQETQNFLAAVPQTGIPVGEILYDNDPSTFSEYAAFADLTFHVTDRLDVQVGGRESRNHQSYSETFVGPVASLFLGASPLTYPKVSTHDNSFTYLLTPSFRFSQDLMLYARLASGYRPGGPNAFAAGVSTTFGLPSHYGPDKTQNYELGVKGDLLEHVVSFDASLYYIDWRDIQLQLADSRSGAAYGVNASRAKSDGIELSVQARPLSGLKIGAWMAWNDAVLTQSFPAASTAYGVDGDRLPDSARFSGNLSVDQQLFRTGTMTASIGAAVSYVGNREGVFTMTPQRQYFPSYAKTDAHAAVSYESWTANLFVTNLADRRGLLAGGLGTLNPVAFNYIQPRTVGVSLMREF